MVDISSESIDDEYQTLHSKCQLFVITTDRLVFGYGPAKNTAMFLSGPGVPGIRSMGPDVTPSKMFCRLN